MPRSQRLHRRAAEKTLTLDTPAGFDFKRTISSHGWCRLAPFTYDEARPAFLFPLRLSNGCVADIELFMSDGSLKLGVRGECSAGELLLKEAARAAKHMVRIDEDLSPFYEAAKTIPGLEWIAESGMGRLLRSPSVFEDLVKMICTTNCNWGQTVSMVRVIVDDLGPACSNGRRAFPDAARMAAADTRFFVEKAKAGYRGEYLKELAGKVANGDLNPEEWLDRSLSEEELKKRIRAVKGAGNYVVENMMKLLGRYDGLALDSWCRAQYSKLYHGGRLVKDTTIARRYRPFGSWRGLAMWCDLTRDWFDGDGAGTEKSPPGK